MAPTPQPHALRVPLLCASRLMPRSYSRRPLLIGGLLAALATSLAPLPVAAAGGGDEGPSFSCAAARSAAEKAICADPALAALDRRMASVYAKTLAALDAPGRTALRADQRAFLEARDIQMTQARPDDYELKGDMQSRVGLLEAIDTKPHAGWVGSWVNTAGQIVVTPGADGAYLVSISTVQPYPSYPMCDVTASARVSGGVLVVGGAPAELKDNEGWTVTLTRKGLILAAELVRPKGADAGGGPPFCGFRASIDGSYLPTKAIPKP